MLWGGVATEGLFQLLAQWVERPVRPGSADEPEKGADHEEEVSHVEPLRPASSHV